MGGACVLWEDRPLPGKPAPQLCLSSASVHAQTARWPSQGHGEGGHRLPVSLRVIFPGSPCLLLLAALVAGQQRHLPPDPTDAATALQRPERSDGDTEGIGDGSPQPEQHFVQLETTASGTEPPLARMAHRTQGNTLLFPLITNDTTLGQQMEEMPGARSGGRHIASTPSLGASPPDRGRVHQPGSSRNSRGQGFLWRLHHIGTIND